MVSTRLMSWTSLIGILTLLIVVKATPSTIYKKIGTTITLSCPYVSVQHPTKWLGPPRLTTYSYKTSVKESLPHYERLKVTGDHSAGEYNLEIRNFSYTDAGFYRCLSINRNNPIQGDFRLHVYRYPYNMTILNEEKGRVTVQERQHTFLNCSVESGNPVGNLEWKRAGETMLIGGPDELSYSFQPTRNDHMVMFTCHANNSETESEVTHSIRLHVELMPKVRICNGESTLSVMEGDSMTLQCCYDTNVTPVQFMWQQNNISISSGEGNGNTSIPLQIKCITRRKSGSYRCTVWNDVGVGSDEVYVVVMYKPESIKSKYHVNTVVGVPVNISIIVNSYRRPVVSWTYSAGGRQGIWTVVKHDNSSSYTIRSSVVAESNHHIGSYGLRVRNDVGSLDLSVVVMSQQNDSLSISEKYIICNASSTVAIHCLSNTTNYTFHWRHYVNDILIRSLNGTNKGNMSTLTIRYCNYEDDGIYMCSVKTKESEYSAHTTLSVFGPPVVTNQSISFDSENVTLSVYFHSNPGYHVPMWFYKKGDREYIIDMSTDQYSQDLLNSYVVMTTYGMNVIISGYRTSLNVMHINLTNIGDFICQIRNEYGATETSFNSTNLNKWLTVPPDTTIPTSTFNNTGITDNNIKFKKGYFPVYHIYLYVGSLIGLLLVSVLASLLIVNIRKRRHISLTDVITSAVSIGLQNSGLSSSNLQEERMPPSPYESDYEEIADILGNTINRSDNNDGSNSNSSTSLNHDNVFENQYKYEYLDNTKTYVHAYDRYSPVNDKYGKRDSISNHDGSHRSYSISNDDSRGSYCIPNNAYLIVLGSLYNLHPENSKLIENVQDESASMVTPSKKYNSI